MKTDDVDAIPENNYIFDIDCLQTMKGLDGREVWVKYNFLIVQFGFLHIYNFGQHLANMSTMLGFPLSKLQWAKHYVAESEKLAPSCLE